MIVHLREAGTTEFIGRTEERPIFRIWYNAPPPGGGQIPNMGWNLFEARWHRTRQGRPVKNRYPRWARLGVYDTRLEALNAAIEHFGISEITTTKGDEL